MPAISAMDYDRCGLRRSGDGQGNAQSCNRCNYENRFPHVNLLDTYALSVIRDNPKRSDKVLNELQIKERRPS